MIQILAGSNSKQEYIIIQEPANNQPTNQPTATNPRTTVRCILHSPELPVPPIYVSKLRWKRPGMQRCALRCELTNHAEVPRQQIYRAPQFVNQNTEREVSFPWRGYGNHWCSVLYTAFPRPEHQFIHLQQAAVGAQFSKALSRCELNHAEVRRL
jgi:hypothetical protein